MCVCCLKWKGNGEGENGEGKVLGEKGERGCEVSGEIRGRRGREGVR